jgi:mono/diheme cytochrome c family protein
MAWKRQVAALLALLGCCGLALAQAQGPAPHEAGRGELLYSVHCIACHTTKMHWREKKLAVDWPTLLKQVNRWQAFSELGWRQADIEEVARYLNALYYHYPAEG